MIALSGDKLILLAIKFSQQYHAGQTDDDGLPYFEHPLKVAEIIRLVTDDPEIISAAYMHDVLEDTAATVDQLNIIFGEHIANLILEVTHEGKNDAHGYYFPRLHSRDAIMIKFADRLANISRMANWDEDRKAQYLRKSQFWRTE